MPLDLHKHRFSGGVLIYDLINTVSHRKSPDLAADRLTEPVETAEFARVAKKFRPGEVKHFAGSNAISASEHQSLINIRELAYSVFRTLPNGEPSSAREIAKLLRHVASALENASQAPFAADVALSALRQATSDKSSRTKACRNCDWLFLDKSKNGSRIWCDMAVCGNRQKARLNYAKRLDAARETST